MNSCGIGIGIAIEMGKEDTNERTNDRTNERGNSPIHFDTDRTFLSPALRSITLNCHLWRETVASRSLLWNAHDSPEADSDDEDGLRADLVDRHIRFRLAI